MDNSDQSRISPWDIVVAGTLLTRLPLPHAPKSAFEHQARSVWAFPLVGLGVGLLVCLIGTVVQLFGWTNGGLIAAIMLTTGVFVTGAMHEDGLADCADGFWGGFAPARRLEIMKDSQIGTYGVLALILVIHTKWQMLAVSLQVSNNWGLIIGCAVLSRAMMPVVMASLPNARDNGLSKDVGRPSMKMSLVGVVIGLVIALVLMGPMALWALIVGLVVTAIMRQLAKVKIGGQTGDVLGATQIISETMMLVAVVSITPTL